MLQQVRTIGCRVLFVFKSGGSYQAIFLVICWSCEMDTAIVNTSALSYCIKHVRNDDIEEPKNPSVHTRWLSMLPAGF